MLKPQRANRWISIGNSFEKLYRDIIMIYTTGNDLVINNSRRSASDGGMSKKTTEMRILKRIKHAIEQQLSYLAFNK